MRDYDPNDPFPDYDPDPPFEFDPAGIPAAGVPAAGATDMAAHTAPRLTQAIPPIAGASMLANASQALIQERMADVQMRYLAARQFPRDIVKVENAVRLACQRYELAQMAQYTLPIGGQMVKGPSIRLAEVLAQAYGNLDVGREVVATGKDDRGRWSDLRVYALDLETGLRVHEITRVHHLRVSKDRRTGTIVETPLHDLGELERLFAMHASKRLRECIYRAIPRDLTAKALAWCSETIRQGEVDSSGKPVRPLGERVKGMVLEFERLGVKRERLEAHAGCAIDLWTPEHFEELLGIYRAIRDGLAHPDLYFGAPDAGTGGATTSRMRQQALARKEHAGGNAAGIPRPGRTPPVKDGPPFNTPF